MMIKVLMVCLGNICRSPLAAGILRDKFEKNGIDAQVDSAGTGNYHTGEGADPRSIDVATRNNIDIYSHAARQFRTTDFDDYDLIYAMDAANYQSILKLARNEADRKKVRMLMNEVLPNENMDIPDPYFGGKNGFDMVFDMIDKACDKITSRIIENQK